jgi:hypothetical protein
MKIINKLKPKKKQLFISNRNTLHENLYVSYHHDYVLYIDQIKSVHILVNVQLNQVMAFDILDFLNPMLLSI